MLRLADIVIKRNELSNNQPLLIVPGKQEPF